MRRRQLARHFFGPFAQEGDQFPEAEDKFPEPAGQIPQPDGRQEVYGGQEDIFDKSRPLPPQAQLYGDSIWFDLTLPYPPGIWFVEKERGVPGSGIGVQEVEEGGPADQLRKEVIADPKSKRMWAQESDEVVAINGESTEGSAERYLELVRALPPNSTVTMTFSRKKSGPITVVFPDGSSYTSPRVAKLKRVAEIAGYESGCTCRSGYCGNCWFKDSMTGEVYVLPLNVPGVVPSLWRAAGEYGLRPGEGEYENWIPLRLERAPEEHKSAMDQENLRKQAINKRLTDRGYGEI